MNNNIVRAVAVGLSSLLAVTSAASFPPFYNSAWGGPIQIAENFSYSANASTGFDLVEGVLVMPRLALPAHPREERDEYSAAVWIGLEGALTSEQLNTTGGVRGLWQAGVLMSLWQNGTTEYKGFYEWVPDDPVSPSAVELTISEGDHISVMLNTTNAGYSGTVVLRNLNTSQTYEVSRDAPVAWRGPTFASPGSSAEWIMEAATYINGPQYVLLDWGNASMYDARACYANGRCVDAGREGESTTMMAVLRNETGTVNTRSRVDGSNVVIEYVEEEPEV